MKTNWSVFILWIMFLVLYLENFNTGHRVFSWNFIDFEFCIYFSGFWYDETYILRLIFQSINHHFLKILSCVADFPFYLCCLFVWVYTLILDSLLFFWLFYWFIFTYVCPKKSWHQLMFALQLCSCIKVVWILEFLYISTWILETTPNFYQNFLEADWNFWLRLHWICTPFCRRTDILTVLSLPTHKENKASFWNICVCKKPLHYTQKKK